MINNHKFRHSIVKEGKLEVMMAFNLRGNLRTARDKQPDGTNLATNYCNKHDKPNIEVQEVLVGFLRFIIIP